MFTTLFYNPLYNLLVLFLQVTPHADVGVSIVLLTILVKIVLYPLNKSSAVTQHKMKKVEKEIKDVKKKHNDQKDVALKTMEIYQRESIKPFASIIPIFLQIPIFIALYMIFSKGIVNSPAHLYSFMHFPEAVSTLAFGVFDVSKKYILVGFLTGASYFLLAKIQTKTMVSSPKADDDKDSFAFQFNDMMKKQIMYVFPLLTGITAAVFPSAIGVYWITSNLIGIVQSYFINLHLTEREEKKGK